MDDAEFVNAIDGDSGCTKAEAQIALDSFNNAASDRGDTVAPSGIARSWWAADPLGSALELLRMEQRNPGNAPYLALRLILFLLPAVLIVGLGTQIVSRDVALTVASAFLSVQLVGPYERMRHRVVRSLENARGDGLRFGRWLRIYVRYHVLGRPAWRDRVEFLQLPSGAIAFRGDTEGPRAWRVALDQMRLRRIERLWRWHTITPARMQHTRPPYVFLRAEYEIKSWPWRVPLYRRWSKLRCRLLLSSLGRVLRRHALERDRDRRADPVLYLRFTWFASPRALSSLREAGAEDLKEHLADRREVPIPGQGR